MLIRPEMAVSDEIDWIEAQAKPKRGAPERAAQVSVVSYLRASLPPGSVVAAVKNEHRARAASRGARMRFYAKRKAEGVLTGFPDLVLLLPGARTVLVEMKAPRSGRLSDAQRDRHAELRALGFEVVVATSIETAEAGLRALGVPLKGTAG